MAKQTGLGDLLVVNGVDLSGDIGSIGEIGGGHSPLAVTSINKSAVERLVGLRDGRIEFSSWFNPSAGAAHPTLRALPTSDVIVTYLHSNLAGQPAASCVAKQINYDPTRGDDGSLSFKVSAQANGFGLEWGENIGGANILGAPGNTGGLDNGASTAFGLQAYVQVLAFTGTSVTFKLQASNDNGGGDPYADVTGGAFTAISAPGAQRIATANNLTVKRWLRLNASGTFSIAAFYIVVVRNGEAGITF